MLFYKLLHYGHKCFKGGYAVRCRLIRRAMRILYASNIDLGAKIDESVRFSHYALGVTIHQDAVIGENCQIEVNSVIGEDGIGQVPVIGKRVHIGAGAVLIGGITVGDYARIGANAFINKDVPKGATVVGVPGRIVKIRVDERE